MTAHNRRVEAATMNPFEGFVGTAADSSPFLPYSSHAAPVLSRSIKAWGDFGVINKDRAEGCGKGRTVHGPDPQPR